MSDLLTNVAIDAKNPGILLIDTSGSVKSGYTPEQREEGATGAINPSGNRYNSLMQQPTTTLSVFGRMLTFCERLQHDKYYVVFWNSAEGKGEHDNWYVKVPFQVEKAKLSQLFKMQESNIGGYTNPSIGFNAIDETWIDR